MLPIQRLRRQMRPRAGSRPAAPLVATTERKGPLRTIGAVTTVLAAISAPSVFPDWPSRQDTGRVMGQESTTPDRSFLEDWIGAYEEHESKQEEGQDLGKGVLFAVASLGGRLAGSAGGVQERWGYTVTWAEGMIARVILSADIDEARAAAERLGEEWG